MDLLLAYNPASMARHAYWSGGAILPILGICFILAGVCAILTASYEEITKRLTPHFHEKTVRRIAIFLILAELAGMVYTDRNHTHIISGLAKAAARAKQAGKFSPKKVPPKGATSIGTFPHLGTARLKGQHQSLFKNIERLISRATDDLDVLQLQSHHFDRQIQEINQALADPEVPDNVKTDLLVARSQLYDLKEEVWDYQDYRERLRFSFKNPVITADGIRYPSGRRLYALQPHEIGDLKRDELRRAVTYLMTEADLGSFPLTESEAYAAQRLLRHLGSESVDSQEVEAIRDFLRQQGVTREIPAEELDIDLIHDRLRARGSTLDGAARQIAASREGEVRVSPLTKALEAVDEARQRRYRPPLSEENGIPVSIDLPDTNPSARLSPDTPLLGGAKLTADTIKDMDDAALGALVDSFKSRAAAPSPPALNTAETFAIMEQRATGS